MDDYGGRPHWGKLHFQTAATLADRYPRLGRLPGAARAGSTPTGCSPTPTSTASSAAGVRYGRPMADEHARADRRRAGHARPRDPNRDVRRRLRRRRHHRRLRHEGDDRGRLRRRRPARRDQLDRAGHDRRRRRRQPRPAPGPGDHGHRRRRRRPGRHPPARRVDIARHRRRWHLRRGRPGRVRGRRRRAAGIRPAARGSGDRSGRSGSKDRPAPAGPAGAGPSARRRRADRASAGGTPASTNRATSTSRCSGIGSPPKSQITVRSLGSAEKHSALSTPQIGPFAVEQAVAALAVGVVGQQVEHADRPQAGVVAFVLDQREVVLLEVGVDEQLHRPGAERGRRRGARSGGRCPSRAQSARRYAARSRRWMSGGKSHSGRSPRPGLYTAAVSRPSSRTITSRVAFELYGMRPRTSISPVSRWSSVVTSTGDGDRWTEDRRGRPDPSGTRRSGTAAGRRRAGRGR